MHVSFVDLFNVGNRLCIILYFEHCMCTQKKANSVA